MLAVVRKRRTRRKRLEIKGEIPNWMISRLKKEYGQDLKISEKEYECFVEEFSYCVFAQITKGFR